MLPLVGQDLSVGHAKAASLFMAICIVGAQLMMIPMAMFAGHFAPVWGRKPVFLVGFAALPIRGLLYTFSANPYWLVAVQLLDGIGAGIFGVMSVLVIADLTRALVASTSPRAWSLPPSVSVHLSPMGLPV